MKHVLLFFVISFFFPTSSASAQTQPEPKYFVGRVEKVVEEKKSSDNQLIQNTAEISFEESGEKVIKTLSYTFRILHQKYMSLEAGDKVLIVKTQNPDEPPVYGIADRYRLNWLYWLIVLFALLVLGMTGRRGLGALFGLVVSFIVITFFIVPQILAGHDPLFITIVGSIAIMVSTIYLSHGFSHKTTIAIISTLLALTLTGIIAVSMVSLLRLAGMGTEDAVLLQGFQQAINLRGLLLAGIIIGTLGVLDDTTTTQAATIFELAAANTKLSVRQLIQRGFNVGREHITSLVNTLVLAYAGASLPLFIFFVLNPLNQPLWVILNNEMIVEEIVRTLAGSTGLILAVPITTLLAAFFSRYSLKIT